MDNKNLGKFVWKEGRGQGGGGGGGLIKGGESSENARGQQEKSKLGIFQGKS